MATVVGAIVSPGSQTTDRITKPVLYARAGIPAFWRVELEEGPIVIAYRLSRGTYVEQVVAGPGQHLDVDGPFPVSFDPGHLLP